MILTADVMTFTNFVCVNANIVSIVFRTMDSSSAKDKNVNLETISQLNSEHD